MFILEYMLMGANKSLFTLANNEIHFIAPPPSPHYEIEAALDGTPPPEKEKEGKEKLTVEKKP